MQEIWKNIQGYNIYEVSNLGNVRNKITNKQLYYSNSNNGYLRVGLFKEHKRKMFAIHRLVAEAFIPNIENKPCINHNLKRKLSSALFELKKNYPKEIELINELEKIRKEINRL